MAAPCGMSADFKQRVIDHVKCGANDHEKKTFSCTMIPDLSRKHHCPEIPEIPIYSHTDGPGRHQITCSWASHCKGKCPDTAPRPTGRQWWCTLKEGHKNDCYEVAGYAVDSIYGVCAYIKIPAARARIAIDNNINMGNFCFFLPLDTILKQQTNQYITH